jgi:hypothetical protein
MVDPCLAFYLCRSEGRRVTRTSTFGEGGEITLATFVSRPGAQEEQLSTDSHYTE